MLKKLGATFLSLLKGLKEFLACQLKARKNKKNDLRKRKFFGLGWAGLVEKDLLSLEEVAEVRSSCNEKEKKLWARIWAEFQLKEILTAEEIKEVQELFEFRNTIAHKVQHFTYDLSGEFRIGKQYDYAALQKIRKYGSKISGAMFTHYMMTFSIDFVLFEEAENSIERELDKLGKLIEQQLKTDGLNYPRKQKAL